MNPQNPLSELLEFSILNIDKPSGPTSFNISDFVRRTLNLRKTSHFGTLDPKTTGVLPIALNRACKLTGFFLGHDKEYVGIMRIHEDVELEKIKKIIKEKFLGKIKQTPPVKSRVKRQEREREIISFEILEQDENKKDFLFKTKVQGGTYIRKLIDDLGKELGCGAHMLELRRINAGVFSEEDESFIDLYDLEKIAKAVVLGDNRVINEKSKELDKIKSAGYVEGYINNKNNCEFMSTNFGAGNSMSRGRVEAEKELRKILVPAEEALKKIFPVVQIKKESVKKLLTGKPITKDDLADGNKLVNKKRENKVIDNNKLNKSELTDNNILGAGNSMSRGGAKIIEENKFIAFCEDKFIGIYNKGKPLFVLQEIK